MRFVAFASLPARFLMAAMLPTSRSSARTTTANGTCDSLASASSRSPATVNCRSRAEQTPASLSDESASTCTNGRIASVIRTPPSFLAGLDMVRALCTADRTMMTLNELDEFWSLFARRGVWRGGRLCARRLLLAVSGDEVHAGHGAVDPHQFAPPVGKTRR